MARQFAGPSASAGEGGDAPVLLVASDEIVLDALLRVTAAAGVNAVVVGDPSRVGHGWLAAQLVLVAAVDLAALAASGLPRRPGVVVVGRGEENPAIWRAAMEAGAQSVVWLPAAEAWLVQSISEAARQGRHDCPVLVVVGARGGSGAPRRWRQPWPEPPPERLCPATWLTWTRWLRAWMWCSGWMACRDSNGTISDRRLGESRAPPYGMDCR